MEQSGVGREILNDAKRAAKIHYRHQAIRPGACLDKFLGGTARLDLIRSGHGGIVEEEDEVVTLGAGLYRQVRARRKRRNGLLFVVFIDLEVIFGKVVHVVALLIGHHSIDQNELRFLVNYRRGLLIRGRGGLRRWRRS